MFHRFCFRSSINSSTKKIRTYQALPWRIEQRKFKSTSEYEKKFFWLFFQKEISGSPQLHGTFKVIIVKSHSDRTIDNLHFFMRTYFIRAFWGWDAQEQKTMIYISFEYICTKKWPGMQILYQFSCPKV